MAMRRPRIKVAANLSIRRPTKSASSTGESNNLERFSGLTPCEREEDKDTKEEYETVNSDAIIAKKYDETSEKVKRPANLKLASISSPINEQTAFKFPKPVEESSRLTTSATPLEVNNDEPHSPKKMESKFAYINALNSPRKRIRTESMTSNKSYSDVSLKSRKTIKQEESQKASDAKRDLRKRLNNIQNVDKQSLTMFDMIYYNPAKNPMKNPTVCKKGSLENIPHMVDREARSMSKSRSPTPALMPPPEVPSVPSVQPTPQIKLGPNGEMILDEASLVIENEREKAIRDSMAKADIVYVDEFSGNSGYYSRFKRTKDWQPEETIRFYRCLHTIGTDFSMMIQLFPNRSRRDLKLKFKKEERLNLKLVNKALLFPKEFNIEELQQQFQEEDKEIERLREQERLEKVELVEKIKLQRITKKMQLNQSKNRNPKKRVSKSARVMLNIDEIAGTDGLIKDVKTKRKKSQVTSTTDRQKKPSVSSEQMPSSGDDPEPSISVDTGDENVEVSNEQVNDLVSLNYGIPYIPNGDFVQHEKSQTEFDCTGPPLNNETSSNEIPMYVASSESQPDINAMDIDIVDDQSRKVFEIKAEPKAYPVKDFHSDSNECTSTQGVITLQNLDDQSQTTIDYHDSATIVNVKQVTQDNSLKVSHDTIEYKYYGTESAVYQPMPSNAPIAHPVKSEMVCSPAQEIITNHRISTPPLVHDPYSIANPDNSIDPTTSDVQEFSSTEESNSVQTCTSPVPLESNKEPIEPVLEDSNDVQELSVSSEDHQPPTEVSNDVQELSLSSEDHQPPTEVSEEVEEEPEETDEEPRGLGPLEDIDINSLVLVESQDTNNPGKTIYEIYVIDPETGKLSEKPLDVPEDVIENIRSILEAGEE